MSGENITTKKENIILSVTKGILKKCASYSFFVLIITIIVGIMSSDFMDNSRTAATIVILLLVAVVFISDYFFDI